MGQKLIKIPREMFIWLFQMDGSKRIEVVGMPKDAKLVSMSETAFLPTNQLAFIVESSEFPEVPEGDVRPELELWFNEVGVGSVEEAKMALKSAMRRERESEKFLAEARLKSPYLFVDRNEEAKESKAV